MSSVSLMRGCVELEITAVQCRLLVVEPGPSQKCFYAGDKLCELKGLDELVVGTGLQSGDDVVRRVERCEHEYGHAVALLLA